MASPAASSAGRPDEQRAALIAGAVCYSLWGVLPLYFHALSAMGVGDFEMIAHRLVWSAPVALVLVWLAGRGPEAWALRADARTLGWLALSTLFILINWSVYIWAVNAGRVLEGSLGYYINPLLNMAAGAVLFRERMALAGKVAIALAAIGVAVQTAALGHLPVVSLALAISFCAYGIIRKRVNASAQAGLLIECLYVLPVGAAYLLWLHAQGQGRFGEGAGVSALLLLAGPATVAPLVLFAWAARRLPLTAVGFLQFIAPTLQFAVGVWLGEPFTPLRALSFGFIWAGVAVFAWGAWRAGRRVAAA